MPKCPSTRALCIGLVIFLVGGVSFAGLTSFFHYTNSTEFCTSCHSMEINFKEYKQTPHYKNASGVQTGCADCHVPQSFGSMFVSKIEAFDDVIHEMLGTIDTPEKFEARRWYLANIVWEKMRANDSRECRSCHSYQSMDLSIQDKRTRKKHTKAPERGKTCIDCHSGLVHDEPLEPDDEELVALKDSG